MVMAMVMAMRLSAAVWQSGIARVTVASHGGTTSDLINYPDFSSRNVPFG